MDLINLMELVQAATPGPWRVFNEAKLPHQVAAGEGADRMVLMSGNQNYFQQAKADAAFIAAANPATVLELIALVERQEAELAAARAQPQPSKRPMSDENARFAIEEVIGRGKAGTHKPPTADHWLMPFWEIGEQLARAPAVAEQVDAPSDLHDAIMRLPCVVPGPHGTDSERLSYKQGHRDARHAAAELALTTKPVEPVDALSDEQIDDIARQQREKYGQLCDAEDLRMLVRACIAAQKPAAPVQAAAPALTVWYGAMPESNGKSNFTAILTRKDAEGLEKFEGFTIARSEYPDRVRYEADCVRHMIGDLAERPFILDYDADKHSGYVGQVQAAPEGWKLAPVAATPEMMQAAWTCSNDLHGTPEGDDPLPGHQYRAMLAAAPAPGSAS